MHPHTRLQSVMVVFGCAASQEQVCTLYKIAESDGGVGCAQVVKNKGAPSYKIAECDGSVRLCS